MDGMERDKASGSFFFKNVRPLRYCCKKRLSIATWSSLISILDSPLLLSPRQYANGRVQSLKLVYYYHRTSSLFAL